MPNHRQNRQPPLSRRRQHALPHVAVAPANAQAARNAGIGKTTLHRWPDDQRKSYPPNPKPSPTTKPACPNPRKTL